jgi:hypothetical protein
MFRTWILLILVLASTAFGQSTSQSADKLDTLRAEGYEALYNLDYEGARRPCIAVPDVRGDRPGGHIQKGIACIIVQPNTVTPNQSRSWHSVRAGEKEVLRPSRTSLKSGSLIQFMVHVVQSPQWSFSGTILGSCL